MATENTNRIGFLYPSTVETIFHLRALADLKINFVAKLTGCSIESNPKIERRIEEF
jgi:hypothetical protein